MSIADSQGTEIVPLAWDTEHFGFQVARLRALGMSTEQIEASIGEARRSGIEMLVVSVDARQQLSDTLLARFDGLLADDKVTFTRCLADASSALTTELVARSAGGCDDILIEPFDGSAATPQLIELSIASGEYSRFRIDARFPRRAFEDLYRLWIERSVRHELADVVLVARMAGRREPLLGMITVSVKDAIGSIGLVAVTAESRGRGIGTRLIDAAHTEMLKRGAKSASVVTQAINEPACRSYRRAGYKLTTTERIYHFWPQANKPITIGVPQPASYSTVNS